jgi:magnesium chelatase family protein
LLARFLSRAQCGLEAPLVQVEVQVASGLPVFYIVGLAATAVKESKERVRAALTHCGFEFPAGRIVVNLAPADLPKEGGRFDLAIALGILLASGQLKPHPAQDLNHLEFHGELALDGELKKVHSVLIATLQAHRYQHAVIVPQANLGEAALSEGVVSWGAQHLLEVCGFLEAKVSLHSGAAVQQEAINSVVPQKDLADIRGQANAKRALAVAASGGHSVLFIGPPGCGKSMLAQCLPGLLPALTAAEAVEVATLASVTAQSYDYRDYGRRPLRTPHHSASMQAVIGGGPRARPGEISLAHHGVLFLDELPEFDRRVLEALREPLETGVVNVTRAAQAMQYPSAFQLVAAMNPCPCGYYGDISGRCRCAPARIENYRARISGPLLDRIDLRVEVPMPQEQDWHRISAPQDSSRAVAARVAQARASQQQRQGKLNCQLATAELERHCQLDEHGQRLLEHSRSKLRLSLRSYHRCLRVARSIADLADSAAITAEHLAEALQFKRAPD